MPHRTTHTRRPGRHSARTRGRAGMAGLTAALLLTALTACTSSSPDSDEPARPGDSTTTSSTPTADPAAAGPAPTLPTDWQARLDELPATDATAACQQPSSDACEYLILDIMGTVAELKEELRYTDVQDTYPETTDQIRAMENGQVAYGEEECVGDPAADREGSPCYAAALAVTVGVSTLGMTLTTDEANAGIS